MTHPQVTERERQLADEIMEKESAAILATSSYTETQELISALLAAYRDTVRKEENDATEKLLCEIFAGEKPAMDANNCDMVAAAIDAHDAKVREEVIGECAKLADAWERQGNAAGGMPRQIHANFARELRAVLRPAASPGSATEVKHD
jgi:hypothetical protein